MNSKICDRVFHRKFDHKNIVRCLGITSDPRGELLLILELMEGGDLRKYLRNHKQKEVCPSGIKTKENKTNEKEQQSYNTMT